MRAILLLTSFIGFQLTAFADLPEKADELVSKLSNWELDRQAELQKEIREKRQEVIQALEVILKDTTKTGDLDGALAIKSEIERLSPSAPAETIELEGTTWLYDSGWGKSIAQFRKSGVLFIEYSERDPEIKKWIRNEDGTVSVTNEGFSNVQTWKFDQQFESVTILNSENPKSPVLATRKTQNANKPE